MQPVELPISHASSSRAAALIRPDDIVEEIGPAHIGNDCDFDEAAFNRSCDPVRVVLRRAGALVEATLVPVEQEPFFGRLCHDGVATACFRQARSLWNRNRGNDRDRALDERPVPPPLRFVCGRDPARRRNPQAESPCCR